MNNITLKTKEVSNKEEQDKHTQEPQDKVTHNRVTNIIDKVNNDLNIDGNKVRKVRKSFDYNIAKDEYIKNKMRVCDIRDKYNMSLYNYKYLNRLCKMHDWNKLRQEYWGNLGRQVDASVIGFEADMSINIRSILKKIIILVKDKINELVLSRKTVNPNDLHKFMNHLDTLTKLDRLINDRSTENMDIKQTYKTVSILLEKVKQD